MGAVFEICSDGARDQSHFREPEEELGTESVRASGCLQHFLLSSAQGLSIDKNSNQLVQSFPFLVAQSFSPVSRVQVS
jgi:hypothetical protein